MTDVMSGKNTVLAFFLYLLRDSLEYASVGPSRGVSERMQTRDFNHALELHPHNFVAGPAIHGHKPGDAHRGYQLCFDTMQLRCALACAVLVAVVGQALAAKEGLECTVPGAIVSRA